jgi:hypothetical protein
MNIENTLGWLSYKVFFQSPFLIYLDYIESNIFSISNFKSWCYKTYKKFIIFLKIIFKWLKEHI